MSKYKDITGRRFGRLTVIKRVENDKLGNAQWLCACDCGNKTIARGVALRQGKTKSCGCLLSETSSERMTKLKTTHGYSKSHIYAVRRSMIERCYKPKNKSYKNYGGRGISVCDEWRNNPESFFDWAVSNGYKQGLTLERIDNDGNYCPENCRWATMKEQAKNTRNCVRLEIIDNETGKKMTTATLTDAAKITGLSIRTINRALCGQHIRSSRYCFREL